MVMIGPGWERGKGRWRPWLAPHVRRPFGVELAHRMVAGAAMLGIWGVIQLWSDPFFERDAVLIGVLILLSVVVWGAVARNIWGRFVSVGDDDIRAGIRRVLEGYMTPDILIGYRNAEANAEIVVNKIPAYVMVSKCLLPDRDCQMCETCAKRREMPILSRRAQLCWKMRQFRREFGERVRAIWIILWHGEDWLHELAGCREEDW